MADEKTTTVETTEPMKGKTTLNINFPTPIWATWTFRIYFYIAQFGVLILTTTDLIPMPEGILKRVIAWLAIIAIGIHGFSRILGVDSRKLESEAKDAFNQPK